VKELRRIRITAALAILLSAPALAATPTGRAKAVWIVGTDGRESFWAQASVPRLEWKR
jgi:hypothetical protein